MFRRIDDFLDTVQNEREKTLSIFKSVDEKKKSLRVNDTIRSLERMAWHITQTITEMPFQVGLLETDPLKDTPIPEAFSSIIAAYEKHSQKLMDSIRDKWQDSDLEKEITLYGESWTNGKTLSILVAHEIHHRGEMVALMRVLDMKVPGIYGPSKEEWVRYGVESME